MAFNPHKASVTSHNLKVSYGVNSHFCFLFGVLQADLCIDKIPEVTKTKVSKPKRYSLSKLRLCHAPLERLIYTRPPHVYITMWKYLRNAAQIFTQTRCGFSNRSSVEAAVSGRSCVSRQKQFIWRFESRCI